MADTYQYRAEMTILQGGYPGENPGVIPQDTGWKSGNSGQAYPKVTYTYYYRDSYNGENENSSRVEINATDSWTATYDKSNNLIVKVSTTVDSIVRNDIRGNPTGPKDQGRDITIRRYPNGRIYFQLNGDPVAYAHQISGPIDLGTETFTLPPGSSVARGSFYVLNHAAGFPEGGIYTDEMYAGIHFRNTKSADDPPPIDMDYRPGATYNGSNWMSHNRTGGAARIYNGGSWGEMRTKSGPDYENQPATGDPPLIYTNSGWRNMFNIGQGRWPDGNPYDRDKNK